MSAIIASRHARSIICRFGAAESPWFEVMLLRAFLLWCLILALEFGHRVLRTTWLVPLVGRYTIAGRRA